MEIERIPGHTRLLATEQRQYRPLYIRDKVEGGVNYMTSQWRPTPEELAALMLGAPILLSIAGTGHPPVLVHLGPIPQSAGVMDVDGGTGPSQELYIWRAWALNETGRGVLEVAAPNRQAAIDRALETWTDLKDEDVDAERP